ncbi:MAG: aminotransferase class V-fold PLP-dependent enzyme [Armatimonadetes bacterium]|nr:aminotransferase class V-fold PLP-dependent enzyme [Armatimonadota bacterium]
MPEFERAKYGAAAMADLQGLLPNPFPRTMSPSCMKYLQEFVESGMTCDMITRFEEAFAEAYGVRHCIATPGCTPALSVLAASFGFEPGDEVIVSPITDYGTLLGILSENYIPVFADTEPGTVNISADTVERCITDRTRAILVVHMTGLICDMDPINDLAKRHGLIVYEDACQSVFGEYKGRLAGNLSTASGFSFDGEKTMGSDVGGCIITNDEGLADRARLIGQSRGGVQVPDYGRIHTVRGYAHRMPNCTAAVTLAQLEIIRPQVEHRDKMVRLLTELIGGIPGVTPLPIPDYMGVYSCWMFGMSIDSAAFRCTADEFGRQLAAEGISGAGTARYYLLPESVTFLRENARKGVYPFSKPPASREYAYGPETCRTARSFLETFIRWSTFCEKYQPEHCEIAAEIVRRVADRNRI